MPFVKLTEGQQEILKYLVETGGKWMSPKELGEAFGKPHHLASGWACQRLKPLVAKGLVDRGVASPQSRVVYAANNTGKNAYHDQIAPESVPITEDLL